MLYFVESVFCRLNKSKENMLGFYEMYRKKRVRDAGAKPFRRQKNRKNKYIAAMAGYDKIEKEQKIRANQCP